MDARVAQRFTSLGGGVLKSGAWGFGCEMGFWQRHHKIEPLELLRWASISPNDLTRGFQTEFEGLDDPSTYNLRRSQHGEWEYTQRTYGFKVDHTGLSTEKFDERSAAENLARHNGFLRSKFLEELQLGQKPAVYRLRDDRLSVAQIEQFSDTLRQRTSSVILFMQLATHAEDVLTVRQLQPGLLLGLFDFFAHPRGQRENFRGWDLVLTRAVEIIDAVRPDGGPST